MVPQGTVLGPLMFLLYINNNGDKVNQYTIRLFADECLLYKTISNQDDGEDGKFWDYSENTWMVQTFLVRSQAKICDKWREVSMDKDDFRSADGARPKRTPRRSG